MAAELQNSDTSSDATKPHHMHCFVVMPFGRTEEDIRWFRGWYQVVIQPAVEGAGFIPLLAATEEQPGAINDEIRAHLAFDPMVVVDLGGTDPDDDPNPNVMYELGIRHALGLPLVVMAWHGQRLPFDVGNQRVIMEHRDLVDLDMNRRKLVAFIQNAAQGKYYRPMEAVARGAALQLAVRDLGPESLTGALVEEIGQLREIVTSFVSLPQVQRVFQRRARSQSTIKFVLRSQAPELWTEYHRRFLKQGGSEKGWVRFVKRLVDPEMHGWRASEWRLFLEAEVARILAGYPRPKLTPPDAALSAEGSPPTDSVPTTEKGVSPAPKPLTEELLAAVLERLPPRPWPKGISREIATALGISGNMASKAITELIRRTGALNDGVPASLESGDTEDPSPKLIDETDS